MSDRGGGLVRPLMLLFLGFVCTSFLLAQVQVRSGFLGLVLPLSLSFAAMELAPLPLPRGEQFRLDAGVALASMLLLDPLSAGLTALAGSALGVLLTRFGSTKNRDLLDVLRTGLTVYTAAAVWSYAGLSTTVDPGNLTSWANALFLGLLYMGLDLVGWTILETRVPGARLPRSLGNLLGLLGSVYLGEISAGIAIAVVQNRLGFIAILSLLMLVLIMQHTFGLLLRVKAAYTMTVSALSRVAEMSQEVKPGHGERVAELAASVGRRLGLSATVVERLTLAALLHDIGGVRTEPIASRSIRAVERSQASIGATLISRVNFLSSLAPVIARHANPYSEYIDTHDVDGFLARIIHVISDYDRMVNEADKDSVSALEALLRGRGREYDPRVIDVLESLIRPGGSSL